MGWHKFTGSQTQSEDFHFSYSPRGWTERIFAIQWLVQVFEPHTVNIASGCPRALILDGHDSHVTIEFVRFCKDHNIRLYCLPAHTTHLLQPLDVEVFGPLQQAYGKAIDDAVCTGVTGIYKGNFFPLYIKAR